MTARTHASQDREWIGGLVPLVKDFAGRAFAEAPHAIIWIGDDRIQGMGLKAPNDRFHDVVEHLFETFCSPIAWLGPSPSQLRVSDPRLVRVLRADTLIAERLQVICAETPELDAVASACRAATAQTPDAAIRDLSLGWAPWARLAMVRATARLVRSGFLSIAERRTVPLVTCERAGIGQTAVCLLAPPARGAVMVDGFPYDPARILEDDAPPIVLTFKAWEDLAPAARADLEPYRAEVASEAAYPVLYSFDGEGERCELDAHDRVLAEAVALALASQVNAPEASLSVTVPSHVGGIEIGIRGLPLSSAFDRQLSDVEDRWRLERGMLLRSGTSDPRLL